MTLALPLVELWIPPVSRYGMALQERRENVGFRMQSDLARAVKALEERGDLPEELRSFSQQWLSQLENDRTGDTIHSARPRQIRALAYMLKWSAADFEHHVGVPIGSVPGYDTPAATPRPSRGLPATTDDRVEERPIPAALAEAVSLFGQRAEWAELREYRWQRFLADLHHRKTPQTAGEWLSLFLDLRERFDPPEVTRGSSDS